MIQHTQLRVALKGDSYIGSKPHASKGARGRRACLTIISSEFLMPCEPMPLSRKPWKGKWSGPRAGALFTYASRTGTRLVAPWWLQQDAGPTASGTRTLQIGN